MKVNFKEGGDRAFYSADTDTVALPEMAKFDSEYDFEATALHELCHATGHVSRLNRDLTGGKNSPKYAKEELRAEIASSFICGDLHLSKSKSHIENHKAYIQSWIQILSDDPNELFKAITEANKISDYVETIGEMEKFLNLEKKEKEDELDKELNTIISEYHQNLEDYNRGGLKKDTLVMTAKEFYDFYGKDADINAKELPEYTDEELQKDIKKSIDKANERCKDVIEEYRRKTKERRENESIALEEKMMSFINDVSSNSIEENEQNLISNLQNIQEEENQI